MISGTLRGFCAPSARRLRCTVKTLTGVWLLLAQTQMTGPAARASPGGELSDRERYIELVKRKRRADQITAALRLETELSAKKKTYLVLDLSDKKLYFKVRGRALKAVALDAIDIARAAGPVSEDLLAGRPYTLQLKEGKGVETESITMKSLTPEEAARGGGETEPAAVEQGAISEGTAATKKTAGTGAPPVTQRMEGVAGGAIPPDPPPRYHLGFDGNLSVWVVAETPPEPGAGLNARILSFAKAIGRVFSRSDNASDEVRVTLRTTLDRGRQLFRQLVCGEQMLIVP